jgi:exodeoxyribonuclease-3
MQRQRSSQEELLLEAEMKIISWNCRMAYRKKAESILKYHPDLAIIPECEYMGEQTTKRLWFGDNPKKGLGIFSYSDYELELHEQYNNEFKYIIPIKVKGSSEFNLIAIWALNDSEDVRKRYIGQIYLAIKYYEELLDKPTIIIGDFNWNAIWDAKPDYPLYGNLADVIAILKNKNIRSIYHEFYNEEFGKETRPTLFMYHRQDRPYQVDYCFASSDFNVGKVEVGTFKDWIKKSDHMPIIGTFSIN